MPLPRAIEVSDHIFGQFPVRAFCPPARSLVWAQSEHKHWVERRDV